MYVCNAAAGDGWRDDEYPVSIANHISRALHHIRRDHSQAAAGTTNTSHACTSTVCMYVCNNVIFNYVVVIYLFVVVFLLTFIYYYHLTIVCMYVCMSLS